MNAIPNNNYKDAAMRMAKKSCLLLMLSMLAFPVQADRPYVGLILYTLHKGNTYLLLANYVGAENIWAGFTGNVERIYGDEAPDSAIQNAVGALRCYFTLTELRRSVDNIHFQQPWENPTYVSYFARVPRIQLQALEDDKRPCPEATAMLKKRLRLRWVPWNVLLADIELAAGIPGEKYVTLVSSARHLYEIKGKHFLLREFTETMRRMIAISELKDSTIEFTLPW